MTDADPDKLDAIIEKLARPENWTKHCYAKDRNGHVLPHAYHGDAVCFCLSGAVRNVTGDVLSEEGIEIIAEIRRRTDGKHTTMPGFNDHKRTTHLDVMNVLTTVRDNLRKAA